MILEDDFQTGLLPWRFAKNMTARLTLFQSAATDDNTPYILVLTIFSAFHTLADCLSVYQPKCRLNYVMTKC